MHHPLPAAPASHRLGPEHALRGGAPLDPGTRELMESRMGHSFRDVRVHTGAEAQRSARAAGALAYTIGSDVVFGGGQYAPHTGPGRRLLAHELAHVVQQRGSTRPWLARQCDPALMTAGHAEGDLSNGSRVSEALITTLQQISAKLRYLIAKGGITASDVATKGLNVRRALVLGQILPGVPVWRLGPESRHAGIPYIVFPGNVGGDDALSESEQTLSAR